MKYLLALALAAAAMAQDQPAKEPDAAAAAAPAEQNLTGSIDFGYRWRTDVRGSVDTYRSIVDLAEGMRLFGLEFTFNDPNRWLFDKVDVSLRNWGDPYNTAHINVVNRGLYNFTADYRNILLFDAVPSFANPQAPFGYNQRAFDVRRRLGSFDLDLLPGEKIVPYLSYERNSGSGGGVSSWVLSGSEFAVPTVRRDLTDNYRGGVRLEFNRWHVTLEEGGTVFKDDEAMVDDQTRRGNRTTPFLGRVLTLNSIRQAYGIRGTSTYSRALVTANPFSWLDIHGQFLFSQPKTDINYVGLASGALADPARALLFNTQFDTVAGAANRPHVSGNLGFELRPFKNFRIVQTWMTDRFHDAAFATLTSLLLTGATTLDSGVTTTPDRQVVNYNRNQTDLIWDVTSRLTLRGGYRYEWGDITVRSGVTSQVGALENGKLNRQVGIAGVNVRPFRMLSANVEYEGASTTHAYMKTSLYNYRRFRARARFKPTNSLAIHANFSVLDNDNPLPGLRYEFQSRDNSLSLNWTPKDGKWFSFLADYSRFTMRSDANYLMPQNLSPALSRYRDNANLATAMVDVNVPKVRAKLTAGGSLAVTTGTRPSQYFQPLMRLLVPFGKNVAWNSEWQWYGFNQDLYYYEAFRTHLFRTGFKITR
jgi:hypothetical protein